MPHLKTLKRLLVGLALSAVAACAQPSQLVDLDPSGKSAAGPNEIRIHVENLNFNDARLFAIALGKRTRLGVVGGKGSAIYTLPWSHPQPLRIEIDLLSGPKCTTAELEADPGDVLELRIEGQFEQTRSCA